MLVALIDLGIALLVLYLVYRWVFNKIITLAEQEKLDNLNRVEERYELVHPYLKKKTKTKEKQDELKRF